MHPKKIIIPGIFVVLLITLHFSFRTVTDSSHQKTFKTSGTVEDIFETGSNGIAFKLANDDRTFHIRNAHQAGINLASLRQELTGKPVDIYYIHDRTLLHLFKKAHEVAKVDMNKTTLFSQIRRD